MGLQDAFAILSEIVEQHESGGGDVRQVEATTSGANRNALHVTMEVPVALRAATGDEPSRTLAPEAATLTDDGGLWVEFSRSGLVSPPTETADISADVQAVRATDEGLRTTVELTIDPTDDETESETVEADRSVGHSTATHASTTTESSVGIGRGITTSHDDDTAGGAAETATRLEAARNEELPPYEDTDYLRELYETCDTFTEMSREIEMDVSSETVRRYMIEAGVHEPTTYDTATADGGADAEPSTTGAGAADAETTEPLSRDTETAEPLSTDAESIEPPATESPTSAEEPGGPTLDDQLVTDGLGLPEDVRLEDLVDAVVDSTTVYDVQRHLDLERRRTRELLEQLNLLDLVMHRISDGPKRDVSYEEVAARIRQCASARSEEAPPVT